MKPQYLLPLLILAIPYFAAANEPDVHVFKHIDGPPLEIHGFYPESKEEKSPAMIWFYGSAFERRDNLHKRYPHCRTLADRGMASFSADIRGIQQADDPLAELLLCLQDAISAYQWVYENADELNIDRNRIGIGGNSSGATLALMVCSFSEYLAPEDSPEIPVNPSVQVLLNPIVSDRLMKKPVAPILHIKPGVAPSVIFHGTLDPLEPISNIRKYGEAMESAGNECKIYEYKGKAHGFHNYRKGDNPMYSKVLEDMLAYLEKHGHIEAIDESP